MAKIDRNDPCWCGSGMKYKFCHLKNDTSPSTNLGDLLGGVSSSFGTQCCLHPSAPAGCSKGIIKAHTIQRSGALSKLADDGHVITLDPGTATLIKTGALAARRIGLNIASTFTGFCNTHDTETFRPIETQPILATHEHAFLLAYRAISRGLFFRRGRSAHTSSLTSLNLGTSPAAQAFDQMLDVLQTGVAAGLSEMEAEKIEYDQSLLAQQFSTTRFFAIEIPETPVFACSGYFQPEYDFEGNRLQNLADIDKPSDLIALTVIPTHSGGLAMLSWVGERSANSQLCASLNKIPDSDIGNAVLRLAIEYSENVLFAPAWWDATPAEVQAALLGRASSGMTMAPHNRHCLADDGINAVTWGQISRTSVLA